MTENKTKTRVLFLCVANSCRSQMAEGLARHYLGGKIEAASAGIMKSFVHPLAIAVMKEIGIDISSQRSKNMVEFDGHSFDFVISVCEESDSLCPAWIGAGEKFHIGFPDPAKNKGTQEEALNSFRSVRDDMRERLISFLKSKI